MCSCEQNGGRFFAFYFQVPEKKIYVKFLNELQIYYTLYNNQINARALIGQSAVGYCAGKSTEKTCVF